MSKSREQVYKWLKTINVTGKSVLDVGAGDERKHVIHWLEGTPKEFKAADIEQKDGVTLLINLNDPVERELKATIGCKWDYVFCIETLEHVWNPVVAIENLAALTKERLFVTVPFYNPMHDKWDYLRYTLQWFEYVLPKFGFRKVLVTPRVATIGREEMEKFLRKEGLRMSKVTQQMGYAGNYFDIGYMVEAHK